MDHKKNSNLEVTFLKAVSNGDLKEVQKCLKKNVNINCRNSIGLPPLLLAANRNDVDMVKELLKWNIDVNQTSKRGNTGLHLCSMAGYIDCARLLVDAGADVNVKAHDGSTPLHLASRENDLNLVQYLLNSGAQTGIKNRSNQTPLTLALQQGNDMVVSTLMSHDDDDDGDEDNDGDDGRHDDNDGGDCCNDKNGTNGCIKGNASKDVQKVSSKKMKMPFLHGAVKRNDIQAVLTYLQKHCDDVGGVSGDSSGNAMKLKVNETLKNGYAPLHIASHFNHLQMAQILLKNKACIDLNAQNQVTPLHIASKLGYLDMVRLLLDNGADINCTTKDQLTPLHCASRSGHTNVVEMLVRRGAQVHSKTKSALSPLHLSVQGDHIGTSDVLVQSGADVNDVSLDCLTPLHVAAHCGNFNSALFLLEHKCLVNAKARNGFTALHVACKKNRIRIVELLIKFQAAIEATTETCLTALHVASFMGHLDIVKLLLDSGAQIDCRNMRLESPLHLAMRGVQHGTIEYLLLRGADVNSKAKEHQTPLHIAAHQNNVQMCNFLVQHGAYVNACTTDLYTPLHLAVAEGNEKVVACLLKHGADLYVFTKRGLSPIHLAVKYKRLQIVKLLLNNGCHVDMMGKNMLTALHLSAHYDNYKIFQLLLNHGADIHVEALNGFSVLHIAARKNRLKFAEELLSRGINVNVMSKNGFTPLHLACKEGHKRMVELLLNRGARCNCTSINMLTPMHLVAQEDRVGVAVLLVAHNALIDPQTKAGYTPLHTACHFGQLNMVQFLLSHYADPNIRNKHGHTPLHQAAQQGHLKVIEILLKFKADPNILSNTGNTALSIARQFNYTSIVELLRSVSTVTNVEGNVDATMLSSYKLMVPETMQETSLIELDDTYATNRKRYFIDHDNVEPMKLYKKRDDHEKTTLKLYVLPKAKDPYHQQHQHQQLLLPSLQQQQQPLLSLQQQQQQQQQWNYQQQLYNSSCNIVVDKQQLENELRYTSEPFHSRCELNQPHEYSEAIIRTNQQPAGPVLLKPLSIFQGIQRNNTMQPTTSTSSVEIRRSMAHKSLKDLSLPPSASHTFVQMRSGRSESNLHPSRGLYCKLLHPDEYLASSLSTSPVPAAAAATTAAAAAAPLLLPQLLPGQALASWIVQCFPAGKLFSRPVLIDVPHFASLRNGEREIQVLRCSDGCNWREHIPPKIECSKTTVALLRPIFKGVSLKNDLYKKRFVRIVTANFPMYFALISRVSESYLKLCIPGSILSPPDQTVPVFLRVGQHDKNIRMDGNAGANVSISTQKICKELILQSGTPFHCTPLVHVKPFNRLFTLPLHLNVACSFLKNVLESSGPDNDDVKIHLYINPAGKRWSDITNDTKFMIKKNKVNDPVVIFLLKNGGSYIITDRPVNPATLNFISYQLHHVPFYASVHIYAKRSSKSSIPAGDGTMVSHIPARDGTMVSHIPAGDGTMISTMRSTDGDDGGVGWDEDVALELFCGTADVCEGFANEKMCRDGMVLVLRSQEIEIDNNTYQYFDFESENFKTAEMSPIAIFFRALRRNSIPINIKLLKRDNSSMDAADQMRRLLIGNVGMYKQVVGVGSEIHKQPICKMIFGGTKQDKTGLMNGGPLTPPSLTMVSSRSRTTSPVTQNIFKEQSPPSLKIFKEQKLQPVEINLDEYDNSLKIKSEIKLPSEPSIASPPAPQLSTTYVEGDVVAINSTSEDFKLGDDNSYWKNKLIKTTYVKPMTENTFENDILKNVRKFEKHLRNEHEDYSIKLPSGYISYKVGANPINLAFKKQIALTDGDIENVNSNLSVSVLSESNTINKLDDFKDLDAKKYKISKIIEGPTESFCEKTFKSKKLFNGGLFMSEKITTTYNLPIYEVLNANNISNVEKKRLIKKNTYEVQIIENNIEFPKNFHSYKLEDMQFNSSITHGEEILDNNLKASKKIISTLVSISNSKSNDKDEDYFKQTFECPVEKQTRLTAVEKLQPDHIIEHQKTLITQWVKPIIELSFKRDNVPDLKVKYVSECTDVRDVLVNLYSGKIENHAKNCEVSIIVIPEVSPSSLNSQQTIPSLTNSIKRVVYDVKMKGPRLIQKVIEGEIVVKNHTEEFNKLSYDGRSKCHHKVFTSKHIKPITIVTESDGKSVKSEKIDKLVKTVVKENIFEMPNSKLSAKDCNVNIDVIFDETKQPDGSILYKSTTTMSLYPLKIPSTRKPNLELNDRDYNIEEEVQTDNSTHTTTSADGCKCQHEVKTKNRVKKYFKKLNNELKIKSHIPCEEELIEQNITEKILEIPENITDFNNPEVYTVTTERWINDKTTCGAPRYHHIITTRAFLKDDNLQYDHRQKEPDFVEEIEGEVMVVSECNEEEKILNDARVKQKVITNKYIRPVTTLKYKEVNKVPEISVREDLLKIEINEYVMELDCELCDPDDCVSTVDSYNYIKYLPNGIPVNTEVTKITAKLKREKKEVLPILPSVYDSADEVAGNILDSAVDTISDNILAPTVIGIAIGPPTDILNKADNSLKQKVTKSRPEPKIEIEMKQKVSTSENQQQLLNGYLRKSKTVTVNHFRVEKKTDSSGDVDVKEHLFKIDIQEIITILANIKIDPFAFNCKTAVSTKFEKSLIDSGVEVNKSIITFVVLPKNQNLTDYNLMDILKNNQLMVMNYGFLCGEMEKREIVILEEKVLNNSTVQKIRKVIKTKFRPLYMMKANKDKGLKHKILLDECIEEIYTTENILDVPINIVNKCNSYDFDLKYFQHEYIEYFENGVLNKHRIVKTRLIISKTSDSPSLEIEDNLENRTDILYRRDDMHSNGSLYRELGVKHRQIKPTAKLTISPDLYLESVLKDEVIDSKTFNLAFYIPTCEILNENSCKVEINSHTNQKIENPTQNFQIHIQPNLPMDKKIFEWGDVSEKITEDEKETFLNDGTSVKWKTLTIYSFCSIMETIDQTLLKNKVIDLLIRTDMYVVIVELSPEVLIDETKQKYLIKITKDISDVILPDESRAHKTVLKYVISPNDTANKSSSSALTDSNSSIHREVKVEKDSQTLSDGTKILKNVMIISKLRPYYEIAETREPMLKEDLISQVIDETEVHLRPNHKLYFDSDNNATGLKFKSFKLLNADSKDRQKVVFAIECTGDDEDEDDDVDRFKKLVDNKTCVGVLESKEEVDYNSVCTNNMVTDCMSWSNVYYTPVTELIRGEIGNDISEFNLNKAVVFKSLLKAALKLKLGLIKSNLCTLTIDVDRSLYNSDDIDNANYYNANYTVLEFKSDVNIKSKPDPKSKPALAKKPILKSVAFKNEPTIEQEPKITTKVEEGDVMSRKTEQILDEKLQDGSIIRKSITTTSYFQPRIEKIYIDDTETACNVTEVPLNAYIEESMLHLPIGVDEYDPELWKTDVISVIESEFKQSDGSNVEKKTMHLVLTPKEKITILPTVTPDSKDDVIETRRVEGDIQSNVKVSEGEESLDDGSILKKKVIITKFIKPITERTFKNGILVNEVNSIENIGSEVEEIYLNLPSGVIEPFGSNLDTETSINTYDDMSPEQLPIKRKVIKMKMKLKPSSKILTETSVVKVTGETAQSSHKRIEGDLVSSTSYSERSSVADDGTKLVCKRTTTRFFRPIAEITITNGCISNAEINEQTSHFDISESITELAADVANMNEPNVVTMSSEEIFNDKTPEGVPVLRNVKTNKVVKAIAINTQQQQLKHEASSDEIDYEMYEDGQYDGSDNDTSLWYVSDYMVDGQIYKKLVINESDLVEDKNMALMNSVYPSLFLKKYEINPAIKVYTHTIENQPVVNSKVQEFVDILPDGTKVKRRVTETVEKRTVVKRLALEDKEIKNLNLKEVFDAHDTSDVIRHLDGGMVKEKHFDTAMIDGGILRKMTKVSNGRKFSSETEFMITSSHFNNVDDFYDNN